ncbi:MAG TPA: SpoIIE family protein phosphatase [Terrimicrobiaceae bacterium]|nr:SpoIIE family protein phosphatase [Terrimicrobiaceae bacterium]
MTGPASDGRTPLAHLRHDLRTPINHILGYSELLEEDLADQGLANLDDLKKIQGAARQLLDLIGTRLSDASFGGLSFQEAVAAADYEKIEISLDAPVEQEEPRPAITGRILIVDDQPDNRDVLAKRLVRQGHTTAQAGDGRQALEMLAGAEFDLVLLDVMMPNMDGYTALGRMKSDPALRHIPVIMISALDEIESVVRCIETGAEDFLPKPFNPTLLRARIGASLDKKRFRDQEQAYLREIEETRSRLEDELQEAARYVTSILPAPMEKPFAISWAYEPSTELGGDSFGYHWVDDTHFAIYLLDVCGHGVGAALLSVAAINVIRSSSLPHTDFLDPGQVLGALNDTFQMENHNNMYFTIWYGVYDTATQTLRHASGGHPPALLFDPAADTLTQVRCPGMLIGAMPGIAFESESLAIPPGSRLFVYCDGAYEIKRADGQMIRFDEDFLPFVQAHGSSPVLPEDVLKWIRTLHPGKVLDDDYSFLTVSFPG